jgi:hypothetical protein
MWRNIVLDNQNIRAPYLIIRFSCLKKVDLAEF